MNIFDTPGFGSILQQHEEILKNFIPQSDCIIYVISYRAGLNLDDADFIRFLRDNKDDEVGIFLAINRAPVGTTEEDARVKEIKTHFAELYSLNPPSFLIHTDNHLGSKQKVEEILPRLQSCGITYQGGCNEKNVKKMYIEVFYYSNWTYSSP